MLFTTPTQFAVLGLVLIAGWLLGLASHSGGRKWKERYAAEREAHAAARRDADARVAEVENRHAERERERERIAAATPVARETVVREPARDTVVSRPMAATSARPAYPAGERRGWFDFNRPTGVR